MQTSSGRKTRRVGTFCCTYNPWDAQLSFQRLHRVTWADVIKPKLMLIYRRNLRICFLSARSLGVCEPQVHSQGSDGSVLESADVLLDEVMQAAGLVSTKQGKLSILGISHGIELLVQASELQHRRTTKACQSIITKAWQSVINAIRIHPDAFTLLTICTDLIPTCMCPHVTGDNMHIIPKRNDCISSWHSQEFLYSLHAPYSLTCRYTIINHINMPPASVACDTTSCKQSSRSAGAHRQLLSCWFALGQCIAVGHRLC